LSAGLDLDHLASDRGTGLVVQRAYELAVHWEPVVEDRTDLVAGAVLAPRAGDDVDFATTRAIVTSPARAV